MYRVKGCLCCSVGLRGYFGGFEAIWLISENEFASSSSRAVEDMPPCGAFDVKELYIGNVYCNSARYIEICS